MKQVKNQAPDLAALVDFWGAGVRQALDPAGVSPRWRTWAPAGRLPQVYWAYQVTRTRCLRRKAQLQQALEVVRAEDAMPGLTQCLPPQALGEWHAWATRQGQAFQRASSAVEGRNGALAQLPHNQREQPAPPRPATPRR